MEEEAKRKRKEAEEERRRKEEEERKKRPPGPVGAGVTPGAGVSRPPQPLDTRNCECKTKPPEASTIKTTSLSPSPFVRRVWRLFALKFAPRAGEPKVIKANLEDLKKCHGCNARDQNCRC